MKRYGSIVGLNEAKLEEYVKLLADVWPGVLKKVHRVRLNGVKR